MVVKELYKSVRDHLIDADICILHIDLWNFQTEHEEEELPFNRPAVFFELETIPFERLLRKRYAGVCQFNLHVVSDLIQETSSVEDKDIADLGLKHLDLISCIIYQMDNFSLRDCGINSITYTGMKQFDSNYSNTIHHILSFQSYLVDDSARHKTVKQAVESEVTVTKVDS